MDRLEQIKDEQKQDSRINVAPIAPIVPDYNAQ